MDFIEAKDEYVVAQRHAQKEYKELLAAGKSPHPAVLDELLDKVTSDFVAVSFAGISDEERESYIETAKKIMDNLKKTTVIGEE